jgi:hypothetical protein
MAADDYAIVIGIKTYPRFGETIVQPRNLEAPDDDAGAVYKWLIDKAGGDVLPEHVDVVRTTQPVPGAAAPWPNKQAVLDAFSRLETIAQQNDLGGKGLRVGRRLYVYASGHGFASRRKEAALFVADATKVQTNHIFASRWVEWFANADYFAEVVLWMDCCMVSDLSILPETAGYRVLTNATGGSQMFTAYAARYPLQAVERPLPDGVTYRGVFTRALLEALNGANAEPGTGNVTSQTVRDYVTNRMRTYMTPTDLTDDLISKEPDFGADDPIVFCSRPPAVQTVDLVNFPAALEGQPCSILTGAPPREVATGVVTAGTLQCQLGAGIYFARAGGFNHGFEIPGGQHVRIDVAV